MSFNFKTTSLWLVSLLVTVSCSSRELEFSGKSQTRARIYDVDRPSPGNDGDGMGVDGDIGNDGDFGSWKKDGDPDALNGGDGVRVPWASR